MKAGLILASLVTFLLPLAAFGAKLSTERVVIALKPDKDPELMAQERKSLSAFLSKELGKPVDVIIPLTSAVILEGLANGTIDLGYLSATDMINARKIGAAELLLAGEIKGKPSYTSYWVSLKDKPYTKVEDLRGKPIAFASRTSTSGYVIPMWDLRQKGLIQAANPEEFFGKNNVIYGSGYVSAIERVLSGEAEAAAVSYYVLDEDKHLSVEQRGRLKMMASQGPVPTHVIAVRASLSAADRATLKTAIETLNQAPHQALRDRLFTSKLIPVDADTHLGGLRSAIEFLSNAR
jgi:phosphonate transport system substrate-binding protein